MFKGNSFQNLEVIGENAPSSCEKKMKWNKKMRRSSEGGDVEEVTRKNELRTRGKQKRGNENF